MKIGLISDTHGLLRPEVLEVFSGVEHIVHAGDIGSLRLLEELERVAPVTAVWGNTDGPALRARLPEVARLELAGVAIAVVHGQQFGSPTPQRVATAYADRDLVVFGHSHHAVVERVGGACAVNPGSAGPVRFGVVPTLALAVLGGADIEVELLELGGSAMKPRAS